MNYRARSCLILLLSLTTTTYAEPIHSGDYWQCTTHDGTNKQWGAVSIYKKIALNFAFASCKRESVAPATCRTTSGNCEQFIRGVSSKPMWECTALERTATPWKSDVYSQRYDAAFGAKAYCQQKSTVPGTCYVNLITCSNKNGPNS
jgi:hypothetical protein